MAQLKDTIFKQNLTISGGGHVSGSFPILSGNVGIGSADVSGMLLVEPSGAGTQGIVIKGFTGQTAYPLTIYDSTDNLKFNADVDGNVTGTSGYYTSISAASASINQVLTLEVISAEPSGISSGGSLVVADGTSWDPGSGQGLYRYDSGGSWKFCG